MMINSEVNKVMKLLIKEFPSLQYYPLETPEAPKYPYIRSSFINDGGAFFSEGNEDIEISEVQLDLYSETNFTQILDRLKQLLKENGFYKQMGFQSIENAKYKYTIRYKKEIE